MSNDTTDPTEGCWKQFPVGTVVTHLKAVQDGITYIW